MVHYLLARLATRMEKFLGVEMPYMHFVVEHAPGALMPIMMSMPASGYGKHVPAPVLHMVRLGATQAQDCGECLQIVVNLAVQDGVSGKDIASALAGQWQGLPAEYAEAFAFGRTTMSGHPDDATRIAMHDRYSERGLIEVSMAAASAHFFPVLKRGLGFAQACDLTRVDFAGGDSRAA